MPMLIALTVGCGHASPAPKIPHEQPATLSVHVRNSLPEQYCIESIILSVDGVEVARSETSTFEQETLPVLESGQTRSLHQGEHLATLIEIAVTVLVSDPDGTTTRLDATLSIELPPRLVGVLISLAMDAHGAGAAVTIERVALPELFGDEELCVEDESKSVPDCEDG
jgi:hypothetical protein